MENNLTDKTIFCRDNLEVLEGINSNTIDLIYLDPPFAKNKTFVADKKVKKKIDIVKDFFKLEKEKERFKDVNFDEIFSDVKFDDVWNESDITDYYYSKIDDFNSSLVDYLKSVQRSTIKGGFYYLIYMAIRLIEMKRILKETGSIYLHCDTTISHYLKNVMDKIFGYNNFRNEIVWCYRGGGVSKKDFARKHDIILRYSKTEDYYFNVDPVRISYSVSVLESNPSRYDKSYRDNKVYHGYKPNKKGKHPEDWIELQPLMPSDKKERIGYPTQKPLALLERIIKASSKEGDIVLDPFCGCATTCVASEKLNRQWVGIDINQQAYYLNYYRMLNSREYLTGGKWENLYGKLKLIKEKSHLPKRTDITEDEKSQIDHYNKTKTNIKKQRKKRLTEEERKIARELLYEEQRGICNGCDTYLRNVDLTVDHIKPRAEDGTDDLDNLQLLCYRCNNWKSTKTMNDLYEKLLNKKVISQALYNAKTKTLI